MDRSDLFLTGKWNNFRKAENNTEWKIKKLDNPNKKISRYTNVYVFNLSLGHLYLKT